MKSFLRLAATLAVLGISSAALAQAVPPASTNIDQQIQELRQRLDAMERLQRDQARQPQAPVQNTQGRAPASETASDETVERALERSLIEQGGQLLAPYSVDVVPLFELSHSGTSQLGLLGATAVPVTTRQDILETGVVARMGLPWASQLNVHLPFITAWSDTTVLGRTSNRTDTGIGDIDLGISKQLLFEKGAVPDLIASVDWKTTTGSTAFVSQGRIGGTGSGFDAISGSVTAAKRQDPLVFVGSLSYTHEFDANHAGISFSPGDEFEQRLGTILAASPDTSLRFFFDNTFIERQSIGGARVAGSDQTIAFLEIGASSVISASTLLDFEVDIGMTHESPGFRAILSAPIHF